MKYHECMHLGGQQQFHAALSLYMKVVFKLYDDFPYIVGFLDVFGQYTCDDLGTEFCSSPNRLVLGSC